MINFNFRKYFIIIFLVSFLPLLNAEDKRIIPLDIYLIIDDSEAVKTSKGEIIAWINEQVLDRILTNGDKVTVLAAGNKVRTAYSDVFSGDAGKKGIRDTLQKLETAGKTADFSGALQETVSKISQTPRERLAMTILITASVEGLEPVLTGSSPELLRWFRSEKSQRWQALIAAPDIGKKVRGAAAAYMSSQR